MIPGQVVIPDWATDFSSFGLLHGVTVGLVLLSMIVAIGLGKLWANTPREKRLRQTWAWLTIIWQGYAIIWYLMPAHFDLAESLPLHVCDLTAIIAPLALLIQKRFLRTLLFFWGLGLSTQALISPVLHTGINSIEFWLFWVGHTQIIGSAAYDAAVLGFRPGFRDYLLAAWVSVLGVVVMLALDVSIQANYWYVGKAEPDSPSLIDFLGPWPIRVVWMTLLGLAVMAALWGLFYLAGSLGDSKDTD